MLHLLQAQRQQQQHLHSPELPERLTPQHVRALLSDLRTSARHRGLYRQPVDPHGDHLVVRVEAGAGAGGGSVGGSSSSGGGGSGRRRQRRLGSAAAVAGAEQQPPAASSPSAAATTTASAAGAARRARLADEGMEGAWAVVRVGEAGGSGLQPAKGVAPWMPRPAAVTIAQ